MPGPAVIASLAGLAAGIVPLVVKVLGAFGIGFITYVGVGALLTSTESLIASNLTGGPFPQLIGVLGVMQVDTAVTMIFSALTMRATLRGMGVSGAIRKIVS